MRFFRELQRRRVFRVAAAYAVVGWLLIQVATQVFPFFDLPNWSVRLIVLLVLAGFPIALVLAWAFDATAQGIVRTDDAGAPARGARRGAAVVGVIGILLAVLAGFGYWRWHGPAPAEKPVGTMSAPLPAAAPVHDKSIAVLPLFGVGADPKDDYLGDGISEEVLNALSKLPGLHVIGRASSFQFRGNNVDAGKIGRALNVGSLLSGTVQRAGDTLRITVELIDTQTGVQLWSQRYDRTLQNLFALEDDISSNISAALAVQLGARAGQPLVGVGTENAHAHDLVLRARQLALRSGEADLNQAVVLYNQAIAEDPNYAAAWAGLASTYEFLADAYRAPTELLPAMKGAAEKAVALDPHLAEGHAYLSNIVLAYEHDFPTAKREVEQALALNPGSADVREFAGIDQLIRQEPAAARAELEIAEKIDPLNPYVRYLLEWTAIALGDYPTALQEAQQTLKLDPEFFYFTDPLTYAYGSFGRWQDCIDRANVVQARAGSGPDYMAAICRAHGGDSERARAILGQLEAASRTRYVDQGNISQIRMALGDKEGALTALEQAYRDRSALLLWVWFLPEFKPLHDDPRYQALFDRVYATAQRQGKQATAPKADKGAPHE